MSRRNPITGLLQGSIIGLVQDSLTRDMIGMYGIAKTLVGFAASQLGGKIDSDNPGSRFLIVLTFYIGHQAAYFAVARRGECFAGGFAVRPIRSIPAENITFESPPPGVRFFVFNILRTKYPQNIPSKAVIDKIFRNKGLGVGREARASFAKRRRPSGSWFLCRVTTLSRVALRGPFGLTA